MHRRDMLKRASDAVMDRGASYGEPEDNFARIAARWNAHLHNIGIPEGRKVDLTPTDVAIMMADVKLARGWPMTPQHEDSWVDPRRLRCVRWRGVRQGVDAVDGLSASGIYGRSSRVW